MKPPSSALATEELREDEPSKAEDSRFTSTTISIITIVPSISSVPIDAVDT